MAPCLPWLLPDWAQDGIRMAAGSLPFLIADVLTRSVVTPASASDFRNAFLWAAVTVSLISAPIMGKVAQTGAQRCAGTVIGAHASTPHACNRAEHPCTLKSAPPGFPLSAAGGCFGWAMAATSEYACSVAGLFLVTMVGTAYGSIMKVEYAGKLAIITYLIGEHHWELQQPPSLRMATGRKAGKRARGETGDRGECGRWRM